MASRFCTRSNSGFLTFCVCLCTFQNYSVVVNGPNRLMAPSFFVHSTLYDSSLTNQFSVLLKSKLQTNSIQITFLDKNHSKFCNFEKDYFTASPEYLEVCLTFLMNEFLKLIFFLFSAFSHEWRWTTNPANGWSLRNEMKVNNMLHCTIVKSQNETA